ncbi:MAG TPA: hypothetical protein PKA13_17385 [Geminicoccaceae bacterium]|nr:hypothetical protein [Geminicoccus sp.]HMU51551.1 hypothetical protein [Geminicoccaceae bacterium]
MRFDPVRPVVPGGYEVAIPPLAPLAQHFRRVQVDDVTAATRAAIERLELGRLDGKSVAITAGSRGIPGIVQVLKATVAALVERGASPFVVPAMGSHGGATAEGQIEVLASYGVVEQAIGAPIRATMETVVVDRLPDGTELHADRYAAAADGIVVFNKIKPHTGFKGPIESGLAKMLVIGLGKHAGARAIHGCGMAVFAELIPRAAERLIADLPVLFGLGLVENAWGRPALIEAIRPRHILAREAEILVEAKQLISRLLLPEIDVLIVDRIGKDVSGSGMDPNVTGRSATNMPGFTAPPIEKIIVRGLTERTHGNAVGIGLADFTTRRVVEQIDYVAMYTNAFSARVMRGARLPVILANDRDALMGALQTCFGKSPEQAKVVRIRDTKHLEKIAVSQAVLDEVAGSSEFEVLGQPEPLRFDDEGDIVGDLEP